MKRSDNMENIYYVYEWIRLDTNEPFYIGKGKRNRCYKLIRDNNSHFNNIVKSIPVAVNILHDNLDEKTALGLEVWYIREYRDIIGYNLVNITDGGEGCVIKGWNHSEETKKILSKKMKGKEKDRECRMKISKSLKNKKHSMEHNKKVKENHADFKGRNNPRAKSVICITTGKIFFTLKDGAEYYGIKNTGHIAQCCKNKRKSCGRYENKKLVWKYLIWNHGKIYRIKNDIMRRTFND